MDRALAALERKDQYRRIAMGACALRLQMLALPRPAIIDFAAERERGPGLPAPHPPPEGPGRAGARRRGGVAAQGGVRRLRRPRR